MSLFSSFSSILIGSYLLSLSFLYIFLKYIRPPIIFTVQHQGSRMLHNSITWDRHWHWGKESNSWKSVLDSDFAAFRKIKDIFQMRLPINLKKDLYNQCILSIIIYGAETWVLTRTIQGTLNTNQRIIECKILEISLRQHKTNHWIRPRTRAQDVIERAAALMREWAEHVARGQEK